MFSALKEWLGNMGGSLLGFVQSVVSAVLTAIVGILNRFASLLSAILPVSPFKELIAGWEVPEGVKWLNWFIDVEGMLKIFSLWLVAYVVYLGISVILRWAKIIGD